MAAQSPRLPRTVGAGWATDRGGSAQHPLHTVHERLGLPAHGESLSAGGSKASKAGSSAAGERVVVVAHRLASRLSITRAVYASDQSRALRREQGQGHEPWATRG